MNKPLTRAEVPLEDTWNLTDLFATHEAWSAELQSLPAAAESVTRHRGRLGEGAAVLMACLDAREALFVRLQRALIYANLCQASDGTDATAQAAHAQAGTVHAQVAAAVAFVEPEVLALPPGTLQRYLDELPALQTHQVELDDMLARQPHTLGSEAEQAIAALGQVLDGPFNVYLRAKSGDLQVAAFQDDAGRTHPNSFNLFESTWEGHPDPALRRRAWAAFTTGLRSMRHTFAATLGTEVAKQVALARLRRYPDTEGYLLHAQKVPRALYDRVRVDLQAGIAVPMRRYARLRQRVQGLDRLLYCDVKTPLAAAGTRHLSFDEVRTLILDALAPLGAEYQAMLSAAFSQRWIDRATNIGKSSGAFCASPYGVHPYILISWTGSMRNVFTLAHELGHAGHFLLAGRHQRFMNTRPTLPFIEAPSTLHEVLLARHILDRSQDANVRREVIELVLGTYHHNFVTHLLEAELQHRLFAQAEAGRALTADWLDETQRDILRRFWGDALTLDDGAAMTWMRQPHYYIGLYPYTYSVGLVTATALAARGTGEGLPRWLEVLAAGGTRSPLELAAQVGVDLSSAEPFEAAVAWVDGLVAELEAGLSR
ncbi:oligoendopeptidase F [Ramlibacter sp.]|uniref:oligoendopeptidase F n=1 Tax=Ramlibacter sp. TaxID=1917967 RepID=UPI0035B03014